MWQNLSTFPWAECWVDSKGSRVKCTTASPLTPFHLLGCSKTIRSGRSRKPVKACEANRVAAWPLLVGGDPTLCGWGAGVAVGVACTLPRGERGCGQRPRFDKPPRGRVVGGRCAKGTHFRVGFIAANGLAQSVVSTADAAWGRRLVSSPTPPTGYLIIFKCSCRASLCPLAEPFQPKLGLSLYERLMPILTPSKTTPSSISFLIERFTWCRFMPTCSATSA